MTLPYIGAETYYNRQLGWSAQDERELMALLDRLDAYGIRYALSAVRSYGGETNEVLEQWLAHGTKTHRIIRRDAQDAEKVLVLNYCQHYITISQMKEKNMVVIEVKGMGKIKIELDADAAPITVENFKELVEEGFYDGLIFHRVISGFMIQGGCPEGTGMGGPGHTIKGEFAANGYDNPIKHVRGVISMARAMDPDSAGSQFFIMHEDAPYLDGQYAALAK